MEKCPKLKLKRKIKETHSNEIVQLDEACVLRSGTAENKTEIVTLTSESDSEQPQEKQSKITTDNPLKSDIEPIKGNFLDVSNPDMRQLRQLIMKISRSADYNGTLSSFPSHTTQDSHVMSVPESHQTRESIHSLVQKRISYEFPALANGERLSSFPEMCAWCRKRRTKENCDDKCKDQASFNQNCDKTESANSWKPDFNTRTGDVCVSKPLSSSSQQINSISSVPLNSNRITDSKHLERDVVSHQRSSSLESSSLFNNSHLMRDRNSNYYSLQSRNTGSIHTNIKNRPTQSIIQRNNNSSTSTNKTTDSKDNEKGVQSAVGDVIPELRTEIADHEDVSTFSLAFDSDSDFDMEDTSIGNSKEVSPIKTQDVQKNHFVGFPRVTSQTQESKLKANCIDINASGSRVMNSSKKQGYQSQNQSVVDTTFSRTVPVLSVAPAVKKQSVQNCPLCQMEFTCSTSQMEIDGHIAACLSAADDDIMW